MRLGPHRELNAIAFLGNNDLNDHKRGVENVILFQADYSGCPRVFYIHWSNKTSVYRYKNLVCIGLRKNHFFNYFQVNSLLKRIDRSSGKKLIVHSHNPLMSIFLYRRTDLFTVHDGLYYLSRGKKHSFSLLFGLLEFFLYTRCNYIHFISEYTKKMSLYGDRRRNYFIIPNTSHLEKSYGVISSVDRFKEQIHQFRKRVLVVRSIEKRAGIDIIIDLSLLLTDYEFYIVGKGPLLQYYKRLAQSKSISNVTFLGYILDAQLVEFYLSTDLVIVPALFGEGFGLPIIEGYLFNKPVFASNVCAIPEVILDTSFLFNNNASSLAEKIISFSNFQSTTFREHYDRYYSNNVVKFKYSELYKTLAK